MAYRLDSAVRAHTLVRLFQASLLVVLLAGITLGNVSVIINAWLSLSVTALPALLRRDFEVHLDPVITLWVTAAALLHSLGMVTLYDAVWWWDHLTHAITGSLVAAVGYAAARAVDDHAEAIVLPPAFLWLFVFLITVAVGVVWETGEMAGRELARAGGFEPILIVYGVDDTVLDLVFDIVGAGLVATLAHVGGGRVLLDRLSAAVARQ